MSSAPRKPRIKVGVIGLGIIGSRVAANLRGAGHQVYVWSRSPHRVPNFLGSVVEVADLSDVIQIFVSDDTALLDVTRTIAAALSPRHLFACHATVSPEAARQAASIIEGQGARYLDAPFTGSKSAAQNRQLVYYVGSTKEALEEIQPVLEASAKKILHVGGIGDASVLKIATNLLTASTVQTLAEALALVRAAGVDGQKLVEALEYNASRSGTSDLKLPAMIVQNFEANFSLKHMLKDARLALSLADALDLSLPVSETTAEVLSLGLANGWADQDFCVVSQLYPFTGTPEAPPSLDIQESTPDLPAAPETTAPLFPASTPEVSPATAQEPTAGGQHQPAPGTTLNGIKERTLGFLRGIFKPPVTKTKTASMTPVTAIPFETEAVPLEVESTAEMNPVMTMEAQESPTPALSAAYEPVTEPSEEAVLAEAMPETPQGAPVPEEAAPILTSEK